MSFAFGDQTRRRVISALANLQSFSSGRGGNDEGLVGLTGPYRKLTPVKYGALPHRYARKGDLDDAMYVVYCYGTPIAWVAMADEATEEGRVNFLPDWQYSPTTTYYQGLVAQAWGDKVADPDQELSRQKNKGTERGRSSDFRYGRVVAARESRPVSPRTAFRVDAARMQPGSDNLPAGAEARDFDRVLADIDGTLSTYKRWTPAHP